MVLSPSPVPPADMADAPAAEDCDKCPTTSGTPSPVACAAPRGCAEWCAETRLTVDDLIYPMFVMEGAGQQQEVPSMPGCFRYSLDLLLEELQEVVGLGLGAIALFPLIPDAPKRQRRYREL